ncbi:pimeloyl-ACP methyl ester esterase BioH [Paraglaciecola sp.]|uniref:pimeloyl-ACP methyl ester esterase BioH n=1 Tax=Paraglaciecola sp. TaxID=1920173 RepID=UPI00273DA870|nr:pimeloyl-ACP methyl ester esterase BioH [Paraglaciecola sp.]MDP5029861.1 pimeloyl-ACP methyl ester esterase BioH [Paraglaciecola sp.]
MTLNLVSTTVGHGPNLVLLHGWGLNSGVWQPVIDELIEHFTVTTIDLPGFGLNHDIVPSPYTLENVASCLIEEIPENSILLGWSLGGLVAQQIALSAAHKIDQLVLLATSPCFIAGNDWPGIKPQILDNFKQQLLENQGATISRFLAIQAMGSPSAKKDIKVIKAQVDAYPAANPQALSAGLTLLATSDLRARLIDLLMPCQLLLGRLDSLVPIKVAQHIAKFMPSISISVFEHSSHAPFISEQSSFVGFMLNYLNKDTG